MNTYEENYKKKKRFSFGKNWQEFIKKLNDKKIKEAEKSLINFLGDIENIRGKTFIDVGCGSGLFSLAAYNLGASQVVSIDIDDFSIQCVSYLREQKNNPKNWIIMKGSVLDEKFIRSLDKFDIVYSWGVLHHTGNMYQAINNVLNLIKEDGVFYLAIYNKQDLKFRGGTSDTWLFIKKIYNKSGKINKKIIESFYIIYFISILLLKLRNPWNYIKNYESNRGMSWYRDVIDWLGGYPYEFASPEEIINFMGKKNYCCYKLKFANRIGCNEYLFEKKDLS